MKDSRIFSKGETSIWTLIIVIIIVIGIVLATLIATRVEGFGRDATSGLMEFLVDIIQ